MGNNPSIGPRVYLVGKVLPIMLENWYGKPSITVDDIIEGTLDIVDRTLDAMGKQQKHPEPESTNDPATRKWREEHGL